MCYPGSKSKDFEKFSDGAKNLLFFFFKNIKQMPNDFQEISKKVVQRNGYHSENVLL